MNPITVLFLVLSVCATIAIWGPPILWLLSWMFYPLKWAWRKFDVESFLDKWNQFWYDHAADWNE